MRRARGQQFVPAYGAPSSVTQSIGASASRASVALGALSVEGTLGASRGPPPIALGTPSGCSAIGRIGSLDGAGFAGTPCGVANQITKSAPTSSTVSAANVARAACESLGMPRASASGGPAEKLARPRARGDARPNMLGDLAKKAVNLVVVLLAAVTFFLVPFGQKTLFEHLKAVFSTPEAAEMGREIAKTSASVERVVRTEVEARTAGSAVTVASAAPKR